MLLHELQEYETSVGQQAGVKSKMLDFMTEYYGKMKVDMGINANYGVEQDDRELDEVLK